MFTYFYLFGKSLVMSENVSLKSLNFLKEQTKHTLSVFGLLYKIREQTDTVKEKE